MSRTYFSPFTCTLLVTSIALATVGCNKKPAPATNNTSSTSSTTTTTSAISTTTTTAESSVPALAVNSAASATALTTANSATSATATTSAPATTQIKGDPKDTVKNHIEALRAGNVKNAVAMIQTPDTKAFTEFLTQNLSQYKNLKQVQYAEPQFTPDKTHARVLATFSGKDLPKPLEVPYILISTPTGWKILADTPKKNTPAPTKDGKQKDGPLTAAEAAALKASNGKTPVTKDKNGKVTATLPAQASSSQKPRNTPIVMDTTKKGTPEDTVKQAMNTLMTGTNKEATKFYISKNPKIADMVATQHNIFQQNLQSLKIVDTKYGADKNHADVNVLLIPLAPAIPPTGKQGKDPQNKDKPANLKSSTKDTAKNTNPVAPIPPQMGVIKLEKKGGTWKILAD